MHLAAFWSYIFITAFTPGPNNIMAMANSARDGFRRGLVFCLGVFIGFLVVMSLCAVLSVKLHQLVPAVAPFMKWIGAVYILLLAAGIYWDRSKSKRKQYLDPGSLFTGMVMQLVNVKVILYGLTALSIFVLPYSQSFPAMARAVMVLSLMGFAGTCCWAAFGSLFQRFFNNHQKLANALMALLLVYCGVASLIG
ncbi:LysE family transporter [Deltaproteobacteria bacterium OttesenSCG-928-K17]|nr:LysE family transporter [Deltaproteobacteria bacterium OttesenSCG-928-K17]